MTTKKIHLVTLATVAALAAATPVLAQDTSAPVDSSAPVTTVTETPTEPTTPLPETPETPVEPVAPVTPVEPSQPVTPTQPTEETKPAEPSKPAEPTAPTDPSQPAVPNQPTEPSKPAEETKPGLPEVSKEEPKMPEEGKKEAPATPVAPTDQAGEMTNPVEKPIEITGGHTVVGTQDSKVIIKKSDGTTQTVAPEAIGGRLNSDQTITIKDSKGKLLQLPSTGEVGSLLASLLGSFSLLGAFLLKRKANR